MIRPVLSFDEALALVHITPGDMTDQEKMDAIDVMLKLFCGWLHMAQMLNTPDGREGGDRWIRYRELRQVYATKHGVTLTGDGSLPDSRQDLELWKRIWKPAFWDTIQEIGHD